MTPHLRHMEIDACRAVAVEVLYDPSPARAEFPGGPSEGRPRRSVRLDFLVYVLAGAAALAIGLVIPLLP